MSKLDGLCNGGEKTLAGGVLRIVLEAISARSKAIE
jgi:hypothetical protein